MNDPASDSVDVARYLAEHPDFFVAHAELLDTLVLPHHSGGGVVSLYERQIEILRDKNRVLEQRLDALIRIGNDNDAIAARLRAWTRRILETDALSERPAALTDGLRASFGLQQAVIRLWDLRDAWLGLECAMPVESDVIAYADGLSIPYCGPLDNPRIADCLPERGAQMRSVAVMALRKGASPAAFGLLVLGSPDPDRFQTSMGTDFLDQIAEVASAALGRLVA